MIELIIFCISRAYLAHFLVDGKFPVNLFETELTYGTRIIIHNTVN